MNPIVSTFSADSASRTIGPSFSGIPTKADERSKRKGCCHSVLITVDACVGIIQQISCEEGGASSVVGIIHSQFVEY